LGIHNHPIGETIMNNKQSGFTLIEIAIVLVIIGLLLGGVLKGQELITQAKIRNVANDLNGMSAAVYGYQDRYKKFPGDDNDAATRWTNPATVSGDGNGAVGAAGGLMGGPLVIVLLLALLYDRYGELALVQGMLRGIAAVGCGLLFATAIRMGMAVRDKRFFLPFAGLVFIGIALLRWPTARR